MPWKWFILDAWIVLSMTAPCLAADALRPSTGQLHLTFTERSPYSHIVEMSRLVPANYKAAPAPAYGLLVFISAGEAQLTRMVPTLLGPKYGGDFASLRKDLGLVLLTGEDDPNARPLVRAGYEGLVLDGFERVTLIEVPHMGHAHPPPQWLDNAIVALDRSKPKPPPLTGPTTQPRPAPAQIAQAKRILITGEYELARERVGQARKYLQRVIEEYPTTSGGEGAGAARKDQFADDARQRSCSMMPTRGIIFATAIAVSVVASSRADSAVATGRSHVSFNEPSPATLPTTRAYDLAAESFEVYVPQSYDPRRPCGLFVWISAGAADLEKDWPAALDRQRVIWICANNAGNDRSRDIRKDLALDAAYNMRKRYAIDQQRVYVGGFSYGAEMAAGVIRSFPDVFNGAICMMRAEFYFQWSDEENAYPTVQWLGSKMPFEEAQQRLRVVLVTSDFDRQRMWTQYECFRLDDFKYVSYLEVPKIGHTIPSGAWLERALTALDRGKGAAAAATTAAAPATQPSSLVSNYTRPLPAHDRSAQAQRLLNSARRDTANGFADWAKLGLDRILAEYADTPAAKDAKWMAAQAEHVKPVWLGHLEGLNGPAASALFEGRAAAGVFTHDSARLYFERVMLLSPKSAYAREAAAWVEWMNQNPQAARARALPPGTLARIALETAVLLQKDQPAEAVKHFQRVIRDYPNTAAAAKAREALKKLDVSVG